MKTFWDHIRNAEALAAKLVVRKSCMLEQYMELVGPSLIHQVLAMFEK